MSTVAVLGANGMLGGMLARRLDLNPGIDVIRVDRSPRGEGVAFDALSDDPGALVAHLGCDWIVNAIGVLASRIDPEDEASVAAARAVNSDFPRRLAAGAAGNVRIIHFTTDAVFSGAAGPYDESAPHDGEGIYARTKSDGESGSERVFNLRCSVIGPEWQTSRSLLDWALGSPAGATIPGYANRLWNGLTTLHLAGLCEALIEGAGGDVPSPLHLVPADAVTKAQLLELALAAFGRTDVTVEHVDADPPRDLRLATLHADANDRLWAAAGYERAPTVAAMLRELAAAFPRSPGHG